jgi:hypothetical protein
LRLDFERIETITAVYIIKEGRGQSNINQHVCRCTADSRGIKVAPDEILDAVMDMDKQSKS